MRCSRGADELNDRHYLFGNEVRVVRLVRLAASGQRSFAGQGSSCMSDLF